MDAIVSAAWATGDPGLVFIDRANRSAANPTPEIEPLEATNPCVVGETRLATSHGLLRMDALYTSGEELVVTTDCAGTRTYSSGSSRWQCCDGQSGRGNLTSRSASFQDRRRSLSPQADYQSRH